MSIICLHLGLLPPLQAETAELPNRQFVSLTEVICLLAYGAPLTPETGTLTHLCRAYGNNQGWCSDHPDHFIKSIQRLIDFEQGVLPHDPHYETQLELLLGRTRCRIKQLGTSATEALGVLCNRKEIYEKGSKELVPVFDGIYAFISERVANGTVAIFGLRHRTHERISAKYFFKDRYHDILTNRLYDQKLTIIKNTEFLQDYSSDSRLDDFRKIGFLRQDAAVLIQEFQKYANEHSVVFGNSFVDYDSDPRSIGCPSTDRAPRKPKQSGPESYKSILDTAAIELWGKRALSEKMPVGQARRALVAFIKDKGGPTTITDKTLKRHGY